MKAPTAPQKISSQAQAEYQSGDYQAAAAHFSEAAGLYERGRELLLAAEMRNNQSVALLRARLPAEALEACRGTDTLFAQAGDARRAGMALANQASALEALHRSGPAIECYTQAGQALEQAGEAQLRYEVMQLLSALYLRKLRFFDAISALQSGLAGVKDPTPRQRLMKKLLFIRF